MRLGKAVIDRLLPKSEPYFVWDEALKGFGLRVAPNGLKSYWVRYRVGRGRAARQRKRSIGQHGSPWSPDAARTEALQILSRASRGEDVASVVADQPGMAVDDLIDRFLSEHVETKRKKSTQSNYRSLMDVHVRPALGRKLAKDIGYLDVAKLHSALASSPYQANRCVAVLSKMFNLAEKWGFRPIGSNPCRGVDRFREERRERFLSRVEIRSLMDTLRSVEAERPGWPPLAIIRLLVLTGARRGEIEQLLWKEVDIDRAVLFKLDSKTGQRTIPLNDEAVAVVAALQRLGPSPYVFPAKSGGRHFQGLTKGWREIRSKAGLEDVRIHDLRHTFASLSVAAGVSLPILGKALGHTSPQTTQRYAHLGDDPVREAVALAGSLIGSASQGS